MTVLFWIVGYFICGLFVGKLAQNIFLNRKYRQFCNRISKYNHKYSYGGETPEEYMVREKEEAYDRAVAASSTDRTFSMVLGTVCWPVAIIAVIVYYVCYFGGKIFDNLPNGGHFGMNAAAFDVRKARKQATKAKTVRELENAKVDEWNNMVDILNENGLNDITKYKKKVKVK